LVTFNLAREATWLGSKRVLKESECMLINISPVASGMRTEKSGNDVQHLMCLESIFWNLK
jgi:hypothetical protein